MTWEILQGDCIERMAEMEEASIDAVVCDPPYGIGFMGKEWDGPAIAAAAQKDRETRKSLGPESPSRPGRAQPRSSSAFGNEAIIAGPVRGGIDFQHWCESWAREALRVLKPGGHLLAFGGSRTHHRLVCGVEDAGFEIRDRIDTPDGRRVETPDGSLAWYFGSGFPKSLDIAGAIDVLGRSLARRWFLAPHGTETTDAIREQLELEAPDLDHVEEWQGWGTALKPAHEPIVVARKPLVGTVAANVLEYGTGGINIGACRLDSVSDGPGTTPEAEKGSGRTLEGGEIERQPYDGTDGRWPANLVFSHTEDCVPVGVRVLKGDQRETGNGKRVGGFADVGADSGDGEPNAPVYGDETVTEWECAENCPVAALDRQSGRLQSGLIRAGSPRAGMGYHGALGDHVANDSYGDSGGASRFFYCAKTSRSERNAGLEGFEAKLASGVWGGAEDDLSEGKKATIPRANVHPTVKPINLMRWLVRLVTPPGGLILDPFLGSGSTGCAAALEGFDFIGIEREPDYIAIAEARIAFWSQHVGREVEDVLGLHSVSQKQKKAHADLGQGTLDLEAAA